MNRYSYDEQAFSQNNPVNFRIGPYGFGDEYGSDDGGGWMTTPY